MQRPTDRDRDGLGDRMFRIYISMRGDKGVSFLKKKKKKYCICVSRRGKLVARRHFTTSR